MQFLINIMQNKRYLNLFASSINGRFSPSLRSFHSAPSLFEISELCIFGFSCAIFRLCPRDQTMNAFIGRFMCSLCSAFDDISTLRHFSSVLISNLQKQHQCRLSNSLDFLPRFLSVNRESSTR